MKRILSGVQSSGRPHLGNYLGAMKNQIGMQNDHECFIFIADLHALTTVHDPKKMQESTMELALDYLALGLDPEKTIFFRQSDVPEHAELAWILNCITPFGLLERAHAYKDAVAKGYKEASAGLFTYPVLMAADILLYKPDLVPVGKDQKQHIEIARDIGEKFNHMFGEIFPLPREFTPEEIATIIGTDGTQKMSKSYGNVIEFFAEESTLKKQIMGIKTDSKSLGEPLDSKNCHIFKLYSFFSTEKEKNELARLYLNEDKSNPFGYGQAKKMLLEKIIDYFKPFREKRFELQNDLDYVMEVLKKGAEKARKTAGKTMAEVRAKTGLNL